MQVHCKGKLERGGEERENGPLLRQHGSSFYLLFYSPSFDDVLQKKQAKTSLTCYFLFSLTVSLPLLISLALSLFLSLALFLMQFSSCPIKTKRV